MKIHSIQTAFALILATAAGGNLRAAPEFQFLGDLPGGLEYSIARGVSADGTYVVGESSSTASGDTLGRTEAFLWDPSAGMIGLGAAGAPLHSYAMDVSADGNSVVGATSIRQSACIWFRGPPLTRTVLIQGIINRFTRVGAVATAISNAGDLVVGTKSETRFVSPEESDGFIHAFRWTPAGGVVLPPEDTVFHTARVLTPDGTTLVGNLNVFDFFDEFPDQQYEVYRMRLGEIQGLGFFGTPTGVSADGRKIVGASAAGGFVWTEGAQPPYIELPSNGQRAVGISADGRTILDASGGIYIDGKGPLDLREILARAGVIDLRALPASDFRANALSDDGLVMVGSALVGGIQQAWRARLTDSDHNSVSDELEAFACGILGDAFLIQILRGSTLFADSRETLGYGDMVSQYGLPWKPGAGRVPTRDLDQPAEFLRSVQLLGGCPDGGSINSEQIAGRFLASVAFPAVEEIHGFEMLLGNEAFADALDPTIGLDGLQDDVSDAFAFKGVPGIQDLLDEELALLRGRELPGVPADWLNDAIYFPEFIGPENEKRGVAVYNRLPPNAGAGSGSAYRSNYLVGDNFAAAEKYPQGHGDAHGHYLTALKKGIELLRDGPNGFPQQFFGLIVPAATGTDSGLETIRHVAESGAARAQSAAHVADLLFRRDYRENLEDPRAAQLFADPNAQRAWSMGDWARRGALGAYLDWAVVSHWAPTDEARIVHRGNLAELEDLSGAVGGFQERLDTAGIRLDPLGLVQNVVPFGIDASGLEPGSGRSHYEQVRDAAQRALDNARKAFELANQAGQRLRDSDRTLNDFSNRLEDTKADTDQQLIEICGLPSADDKQDNDLDPGTSDFEESQSHPDLTNFLATDEDLAAKGMAPRLAPGQIQIAISELHVAGLRVQQAELALDDLSAQIRSQLERIELLTSVQAQAIRIIGKAGSDQIALTRRLEEISERQKQSGMILGWVKGVAGLVAGNPAAAFEFMKTLLAETVSAITHRDEEIENEFDAEVEKTRIQTWKEIKLQGLEDLLIIDAEKRELAALLRRSPQLLIDRGVAEELAAQALGRLRQAVTRGQILLKEKQRLEARTEGDLLTQRWKDMSFRVFRNAVLKNYRALFDIAARYVVLAARAYAYEFDSRSDGNDALAGIYRERRLGSAAGLGGGLQSVLARLDGAVTVNNFNRPLETLGERSFSFRRNLLGIGIEDFPNDDLRFRALLESRIVERVEDMNEVRDLAQVSAQRDFGPAIVLPFSTEIDGRNFFGFGPELPHGNANFSITRNAKIRSFAVRFDGVETALGIDPESGTVFVYLLPAGESVLRENTNLPVIENELVTPWAVVDQFLPVPSLAVTADLAKRTFNPWRSTAQAGGNFLNEIKRQRDSEAQVELGQPLRFNTNLAGRSAWNTRWLLVIPGGQWTDSSDTAVIRRKLLQFIYGTAVNPSQHLGITDIRLVIQAYSH